MTRDHQSLREYAIEFRTNHRNVMDRIWEDSNSISVDQIDPQLHARDIVELIAIERELQWIVDYLDTADVVTGNLTPDLDAIADTNAEVRAVLGEDYESVLRHRFDTLYQSYPATVVDVFEFEPIPLETTNDLDKRDSLQLLYDELSLEESPFTEGIQMLDSALKYKYRQNRDLVDELDLRDPFKPEHYWWRHPEQVFEDE